MDELNVPGKIPRSIGRWECHKLECFADFIEDYASSLSTGDRYYIDPYAGCGSCLSKDIHCLVTDSQPRVLNAKFAGYIFIASEPPDAEHLKRLTAAEDTTSKVEIITGSSLSEKVIRQLFDLIPRSAASFALIDPPGYRRLRWSLVKKLARHGSDWQGRKTELLIIFPLEMALLRNLSRPECEASITRLYGNQEWRQIRQDWQEGNIDTTEVRKRLVALYQTGLKDLGYRYVASLQPAQSPHPPVYLLIWASDEANRIKMIADAWNRPRYLPGEMFYRDKQPTR